MRRCFSMLGLILALGLAACSGEEGLGEEASDAQESRFGLVYVTYEHDWRDLHDASLLTITAQFVRYTILDRDQVARLLALPLDPARDLPTVDRCRTYDLTLDLAADTGQGAEESGAVELLEAGDLRVEAEGHSATLEPRHLPGLLPFVYGVIYGQAQAAPVMRAKNVKATSMGGEAVGRFTSQVQSPTLPRLMRVAGAAPSQMVQVLRDGDLAVRWQPLSQTDAPADVLYLEARYSHAKRDLALRCRLRDDGAFDFPRSMLQDVSGRVSIEISRVRRTFFTAAGLDRGELRVTVRDSASAQLP